MKNILIAIFCLTFLGANAQKLTVATYNLRNDNKSDQIRGNGWDKRFPVIASLVIYNDFDIFGTQEVLQNQVDDMLGALPGYSYIGVGRDDGMKKGEYSPIFYKTDRLSLLDSGHFWLSEDPSTPGKGWDASYIRICTWGRFTDKLSKRIFWFFTLHTDHKGKQSQIESSKLILRKIEEMCKGEDVVLTGDINAGETTPCYTILNESGRLKDSYDIAKFKYAHTGTENYFDTNIKTFRRIDHIFVSQGFGVERYGILTDTYRDEVKMDDYTAYIARIPSDHFPVKAELIFLKKSSKN